MSIAGGYFKKYKNTKTNNMFIPIKEEYLQISETDKENMYWNEWVWNSHKWIEHHKGYYTCAFCNSTFTNMMPIGDNVKLCKHNPILNNECKCG